ncbi:MAG: (d)CMP kinase [Desulfobacteraceae bacterium]
MKKRIVTIDGPAGAGKSTVARRLAMKLGYVYVDTGALYRGAAYEIKKSLIDINDRNGLDIFLKRLEFDCRMDDHNFRLLSFNRDISDKIRSPEISMLASQVSAIPEVRSALLGIQRKIASNHDAVFEGRDMGTVVFPSADFKFFLTADLSVRAQRRHLEDAGELQSLEDVEKQMKKRDMDDSGRAVAPLKAADDAVIVDSTSLSADEVVEKIYELILNSPCF